MLDALRAGDPRVREWLAPTDGDPFAPDGAWVERFLARGPDPGWNRAAILAAAHADGAAFSAWADAKGALVVTGQQPAIAGGALYTVVKTAAAIAIAERCSSPSRPVLPLFWCASEDHDLGEASHADLITRDGRIQRVTADLGGGRASLRFRPAAAAWPGFIDACRKHLGPGTGAEWLAAQAPQGDDGLGAWVCRLITRFFGNHPLLTIEPWRLRPLWSATIRRAFAHWPASELAKRRSALLMAGFADTLGALDDPPLFADFSTGRDALARSQAALLFERDPTVLSPGAALRPVLQQAALPAAIAILGPGELAYHAALTPLYAALAVPRPLLVPRPSLTLAPTWFRRGCAGWGIDPATLTRNTPEPLDRRATLEQEMQALIVSMDRLAAAPVGPDLARRRDAGLTRLRRELDRLTRSLARGERRQIGRPPFGALIDWVWPRGAPQDRTMSMGQAIWEHGPGLADVLVAAARVCAPGASATVPI